MSHCKTDPQFNDNPIRGEEKGRPGLLGSVDDTEGEVDEFGTPNVVLEWDNSYDLLAEAKVDRRKCLSSPFAKEFKTLFVSAIPIVLLSWLDQTMATVTAIFSGQLGKNELAAISLAIATTTLLCQSPGKGFAAVSLTFISQSNGSKNPKQAGVYLQTALFLLACTMLISWSILINIYYILILLGQDPLVAEYASEFAMIFPIGNGGRIMYLLFSRYLYTQNKFIPSICISLFSNILSAVLQYIFVFILGLGLRGSALGYTLGYVNNVLLHLAYIRISGIYERTWGGWSRRSMLEWWRYTKLGLFSTLMLGIEDGMFEVGILLSGVLGVTELAASSILLQLWPVFASTASGLRDVSAVRIGLYLGNMKSRASKRLTRVSFLIASFIGAGSSIVLLALRQELPKLFSTAPDVLEMATWLMLVLALLAFIISMKRSTDGILVGCGKQIQGGIISLVAYIIIAFPSIGMLMFLSPIGVYGYWVGMVIGFTVGGLCQFAIIYCTNWNTEVEKAQMRAKIKREQITLTESTPLLTSSTMMTKHEWRKLFIKRILTVSIVVLWFMMSLFVRFFVLIPPHASVNQTLQHDRFYNLTPTDVFVT